MSQVRYIFLSHNSVDKHLVEPLVEKLEQHELATKHNIKIWLDKNNLKHGIQYPHQFAEAIESPECCAFLVFMPVESVRAYVEHEIGVAFDRQMNDKNNGKQFPLLPVYPADAEDRIPLPTVIKTYNYRENIVGDDGQIADILNDVINAIAENQIESGTKDKSTGLEPKKEGSENNTLSLPLAEQWLCYDLSREGDLVTASSADEPKHTAQVTMNEILQQFPSADLANQLFPDAFNHDGEAPQRLRIRTNDNELAMLPWEFMHDKTVIEVSSLTNFYSSGLKKQTLANPLIGIPEINQRGTPHYRRAHEYFNRNLDIRGPIPRATSKQTLKRELEYQKPDFIYIYASYDGEKLLFDPPVVPVESDDESLTLEELAEWVGKTDKRPIIFLCLIGEEIKAFPKSLVESCRLLWVQSTASGVVSVQTVLEKNALSVLERMDESDLVSLIHETSIKKRGVTANLWTYGKSPLIACKGSPLVDRLRAALLRVMLGREDLKGLLYSEIRLPEHFNQSSCIAYVVTGNKAACPFEVPSQLEQRFYSDDIKNSLPILKFPLSVDMASEVDAREVIADIYNISLADEQGEIQDTFSKEINYRGHEGENCCIALNWYFSVPKDKEDVLSEWLKVWADTLCQVVVDDVPEGAIIVNAICIQVDNEESAQKLHEEANELLEDYYDDGIKLIYIEDALGRLKSREVLKFFRDNSDWHEALQLKEHNIDLRNYTNWIYQHSKQGEFEETVRIIWQQYQNDYNDYQAQ